MIEQINDPVLKEAIAQQVLIRLPEWFGVPTSTQQYVQSVWELPFWADTQGELLRGFLAMRQTSPAAAEIHVMGVLPEFHRSGVGRCLVETAETHARELGLRFLHVKTVQAGHYESYDRTNAFYRAMGFSELEVLPEHWDRKNPCQLYIKTI